jgi:hypothetical protein
MVLGFRVLLVAADSAQGNRARLALLGTLLFMDIVFSQHILISAMLFVMSPFALGQHSWRTQLASVPLLGRLARLLLEAKLRPTQKPQGGVASEA